MPPKRLQLLVRSCAVLFLSLAVLVISPSVAQGLGLVVSGGALKPAEFRIQPPWARGIEHVVTQAYGSGNHLGTDRACCNNDYYALDFDLALGEAVFPVASGQVIVAEPASGVEASYGNIVVVDHLNGYESLYAHLDTILVSAGQSVTIDTQLGGAGGTGGWPVHLHFSLYKGAKYGKTAFGTGIYGGNSVLPEPFSNCSKANSESCSNLTGGAHLLHQADVKLYDLSRGPVTLTWDSYPQMKQFELRVAPLHNDGPGIDVIVSDPAQVAASRYAISPPMSGQGNYVLLPGASYAWQVRFSTAVPGSTHSSAHNGRWGPWSDPQWFTTAAPKAKTLALTSPGPGRAIDDATPTLRWLNTNPSEFYYELQLSADSQFRTGSDSRASVYWVLVHGGVSQPANSWTVPDEYRLAPGTYYMRIRQRVQATPAGPVEQGIPWSTPFQFSVSGQG